MAQDAHAPHPLVCLLQDGSRVELVRDEADRLVSTGFVPAGKRTADDGPLGRTVVGFGPWPSWDANTRNGVDTRPDEESGLFEPERLFVLREQYLFLTGESSHARPVSLGPLHKVYWEGTEHVVQARQQSHRH